MIPPRLLSETLDAAAIWEGQLRGVDNEKTKGWFPVSGFGQYSNLVTPS